MKKAMPLIICTFLLIVFSIATAEERKDDSKKEKITEVIDENYSPPWWMGYLITVAGMAGGVIAIIYKLDKQHKNDLNIQKENYREKLRLEVFQEFSKGLDIASKKAVKASSYADRILMSIGVYQSYIKNNISPSPLSERCDEIRQRNQDMQDSIVDLMGLFEKYEIISPELSIFKLAMNVSSHDITETFMPLHKLLLRILPMDHVAEDGTVQIKNIINPSESLVSEMNTLITNYKNNVHNLSGYLYDLNIELQNSFLSKLFGNQIPKREPTDPNVKVITTEAKEMEQLKQYFEEETNWGKQKRKIKEKVRKKYEAS